MEKSVKIKVSLSIIWLLLTMLIAGAASNSYSGFDFSSFLGGTVFFSFPILLYWLGFWIWGDRYLRKSLCYPIFLIKKLTPKFKPSNGFKNFFLLHDPHKKHPWKRYWARIFDYIIVGIILSLLIGLIDGLLSTNLLGAFDNQAIWSVFIVAVWALAESFLISNFSTTPGKWLFGIQVKNTDSQKLSLSESFHRSGLVWKDGLAFGIPLIQLITMVRARNKLVFDGITSWDKKYGTIILINKSKPILIVIFIIIFFGLSIWGKQQELYERQFLVFTSSAVKYPEERRSILESYLTEVVEILGNQIDPVHLENECKAEISKISNLPKGLKLDCPTPKMFTNIKERISKAKSLLENSNEKIRGTFVTFENDFYALRLPDSYTKSFIISYYQQKEETLRKLDNFFEVERDILDLYSKLFIFLESNRNKYNVENEQFLFDREAELAAYNKLIEEFNLLSEKERHILQDLGA